MSTDSIGQALGPGLQVLQRGWLSSNNIVLDDAGGAALVDSGHSRHAQQTVALLQQALHGKPLQRLFNTHLHSDHCGGNAAVQRAFGCTVLVPISQYDAVQRWDAAALSHETTGQSCQRFAAQGFVEPGQTLAIGARRWQALSAPGHDPHSLMLFDAEHGVLISADALWENGFGVVFPELDDEPGFGDVAAVLSHIESLSVRAVIPGHGAPFTDVAGALQRARSRLAGWSADPPRHARHAAKVLIKYHLLELGQTGLAEVIAWAAATPALQRIWNGLGQPRGSMQAWAEHLLDELRKSAAVALRDGVLYNE